MAKFRLTVLFLISLCIACNRGRISNSLDEKILACGNDAKASTDYIFVSGPSGARSDPGLFVIDGALHVTSKGCVERPKDGQYFVSSSDKKQGRWIDSKAPRSLSLLELQNSNIPAICSGIIYSDNSGFALEIQNYQASADPKFLTLDVKLFLNANQAQEISWATRESASLNSFKFPVGAKLSAGEYKLGVVIKDKLRDVTTNSDCTLRIDDSELKISPADRILEKRRFNGQEVLIVQPGYTLDFYVHTGFRDVKIDFCLERIKYSDISKDLFETSKACRVFPNLSDLVGDLKVEENSSLVSLSGFDNLTFVLGRIDFSNNPAMVTLSGFRSLQSVAQSLDFSNNENLINIPNFLELTSVGSSLNLEFIKIASLSNFKSLKTVGRLRLLGLSNLKDLFGLESLSRAETIELRHNPQLRNFDGLSGLRLVSTIELGDMQIFESFKGLYSIETVASLDIRDCHKVKDLTVNGRSVEITENLDLVGPMELVDLSQLTFASTLRHLIIDNSNLQSLSGFESVNEIQSFQLGNMTRMVTLKGAIGLIKVGTLILDSMDIANLNELSNLREVEAIQLHNLKKLSDLRGLARLEKVGSDLELLKLGITSLQGLKVGLIVLGSLTIAENHNITNLVGLNAIPEVGSHLIIGPNDQLENLSGIEGMKVVGNFLVGYEFIFIKEDPVPLLNLQDISSIQQVKSIGGYLRVGMEGCVDEKFLISLRDKVSGIDSQLSEFEISKTDKIRILQGIACSNI